MNEGPGNEVQRRAPRKYALCSDGLLGAPFSHRTNPRYWAAKKDRTFEKKGLTSGIHIEVFAEFREPQDVGFLRASPESKNKSSNKFPLDNINPLLHTEIVKT